MTALKATKDQALAERARIRRMVHEAMLTWMVSPPCGLRPKQSCWPDYRYEYQDWGAHERPTGISWTPTPRQIDEADTVQELFGRWRGQDRPSNGLRKWEYALLSVRAVQEIFGKTSWRSIRDAMADRHDAPTWSHEKWRQHHDWLMEVAWTQALQAELVFSRSGVDGVDKIRA